MNTNLVVKMTFLNLPGTQTGLNELHRTFMVLKMACHIVFGPLQ